MLQYFLTVFVNNYLKVKTIVTVFFLYFLSPHLFNTYTEQVMREADIDDMGIRIGGRNITDMRYTDDTGLLSSNITSSRRMLYRVEYLIFL